MEIVQEYRWHAEESLFQVETVTEFLKAQEQFARNMKQQFPSEWVRKLLSLLFVGVGLKI